MRIARALTAGAIARKILGDGVSIRGAVIQIGSQKIDRANWEWDATGDNPFWCPDRQAAQGWEGDLDDVRKRGSSCGAVIEVVASGVPIGLGDPVYDKIDADLKSEVEGKAAAVRSALQSGNADAIRSATSELSESMQKVGQAVYGAQGAGEPGANGASEEGDAGQAEEGTVEGEFREV